MGELTRALENEEYVLDEFVDCSKAFDTISYSILSDKLYHYSVKPPVTGGLGLVMGIFDAFFAVYIEFISFAVRFFSLPLKLFSSILFVLFSNKILWRVIRVGLSNITNYMWLRLVIVDNRIKWKAHQGCLPKKDELNQHWNQDMDK